MTHFYKPSTGTSFVADDIFVPLAGLEFPQANETLEKFKNNGLDCYIDGKLDKPAVVEKPKVTTKK